MRKEDDNNVAYFRSSERYVRIDGKWWFTTREGQEGPFATREAAQVGLQRFVDTTKALEDMRARSAPMQSESPDNPDSQPRHAEIDPTVWDRQIDAN